MRADPHRRSHRNAPARLSPEALEIRLCLDSALAESILVVDREDGDEAVETFLLDLAVEQSKDFFEHDRLIFKVQGGNGPPRQVAFSVSAPAATFGGNDFSETNVQVAGIDEGDIIETDGEFIYFVDDQDNRVSIVDVANPAQVNVASQFELGSDIELEEMYLDGNRLLLVGEDKSTVVASVIDVTDRKDPQLVKKTEIDGALVDSRTIDGNTYLIVSGPAVNLPRPKFIAPDPARPFAGAYESEAAFRERMGSSILEASLTSYRSYGADDGLVDTTMVERVYGSISEVEPASLSVITIDMHTDETAPKSSMALIAAGGTSSYMSNKSLYIFQPRGRDTEIIKFDLDTESGSVQPVAMGGVPGRMLSQLAADEMHDQLRVATTIFGRNATNGVYVLEEEDEQLEVIGSVTNLAPGESIRAVKFVDYVGYVVTFPIPGGIDPLFTFDLTDPANPKVLGELKITGFSEQLIPLEDGHLLGIGRDAGAGLSQSLQLSLFDVSDLTDPKLVDRHTVPGNSLTTSPAERDHHAIGFYPEFNTLAIPVSQANVPRHAAHVFHVDTEHGIQPLGDVAHNTEVLRTVRVGEWVASASRDMVRLSEINNPDQVVGQVALEPFWSPSLIPLGPDSIDRVFDAAQDDRPYQARFDVDRNGVVNHSDVEFFVRAALRTDFGDVNLDGQVAFDDFLIISANFGQAGGWADGDVDGDGEVGLGDFLLWRDSFQNPRLA